MSANPADGSGYGAGPGDAGEVARVDARGAMGVQVGEHLTQIITVYSADQRTWTDGVAPPPLASVSGEVESPYRGLAAFEEQDAAFFFGRDQAVADVLGQMASLAGDGGLLVVSGVSGAGKSSLLRAGVLPRLRAADLAGVPGSRRWPCVMFTPGRTPLDELAVRAASLARADAAGVRRGLEADPAGFALTARQAVLTSQSTSGEPDGTATVSAAGRLLVMVDQFEQLFTRCPDDQQRHTFVAALHAAAAARGPHGAPAALVVLAVRADFEARCAGYEELAQAVQDRYLIRPMTARQLELAITEPARLAGAEVDERLVRVLVDQARIRQGEDTGAGVLPLVSHALDQAWRHRAGQTLTLADYERAGGIEGAVAGSAERAYGQLTPAQQGAARLVFTRLTATTSDGVDVATRSTLAELTDGMNADGQRDVQAVLDSFVAERLLTVGAADRVEISHEILLTAWPLLRDTWLTETHVDRIVRTRLAAAAADWERQHRDSAYLYAGSVLQTAADAADRITANPARHPALTAPERDFLRASQRARHRATRLRRSAVAILAVLAVGLATTTVLVARANRQATYQRDIAVADKLISKSESIGGANPVVARLLAVAAWRLSPNRQIAGQARLAMLAAAALPGIRSINAHPRPVSSVAFSPDGKLLASGGGTGSDGTVRLWDVATGREIGPPITGREIGPTIDGSSDRSVNSVAFSPDGKLLAIGSDDGVQLWDVATGRLAIPILASRFGSVNSVAFSPDGKLLASGGDYGQVRLWDVATGQEVHAPIADSTGLVLSVAFSPDGKLLAIGSDNGVRLWDVATGKPARPTLTAGSTDPVYSVAFSPDSRMLASGDVNGTVRLWDVATGGEIGPPLTASSVGPVYSVAFSWDGRLMASGGEDGTVRLWDVATSQAARAPITADSTGPVNSVAFSRDGRLLASGGVDGMVRLWDVATGRLATPIPASRFGSVHSVAFSRDGRLLASGGVDGTVRLWDVATGQAVRAPLTTSSAEPVYSVAFSPDGKLLASGGDDGTVRLWDVATSQAARALLTADSTDPVNSVAFSPDGKLLASGDNDGTVQLWDVATGKSARALLTGSSTPPVNSVAFSPDGKLLASGYGDGTVRLWDVVTGKPTRAPITADSTAVWSVAFSRHGRLLASGDNDGTVRLWDVATGKPTRALLTGSGTDPVNSVAFSPDGRLLASGGGDGTVRLWDMATGKPARSPLTGISSIGVYSVTFSPDSKTLAQGSDDGTVRLWDVGYLRNIAAYLCTLAGRSLTRAEWARYVPSGPVYQAVCP